MKKIRLVLVLLIVSGFAVFSSCRKFVEVEPPKNQLLTEAVFSDSAGATAAVIGIYSRMMEVFALTMNNGGITVYTGLSSDELFPTSTASAPKEFYTNEILSTNSINRSVLWPQGYITIYAANACIEGMEESETLPAEVKKRLIGEVKFIRAFIYFNLVNLYGGVPLVLTADYKTTLSLPRASADEVYSQVIADLSAAQGALQPVYITAERLRPNLYTVKALLAKVYLYKQNWQLAESLSSEVIASGTYSLESNVNNVFKIASNEIIWALQPVLFPTRETYEGFSLNPTSTTGSSLPPFPVTQSLYNAFETGDKRKINNNWLKSKIVNSTTYNYPYKYTVRTPGTTRVENYVVFRLAEQLLIRAEARAQLNNLTGAISDLNLVRSRAGLSPLLNTLDQGQVMAAVEKERRVELFAEWGNRWFDLKRWNKADAVLQPIKQPGWQTTDQLYPVPQTQIESNPFLVQNPGY